MSSPEFDKDLFASMRDYLRDPQGYDALHKNIFPDSNSKYTSLFREMTVKRAATEFYLSRNIRETRKAAFDYAKRVRATDQEANDLLDEIGLGDVDQITRIALLKEAATEFITARTTVEALERVMDLYPPTPQLVQAVLYKKVREFENPGRASEIENVPPAGFFRRILGRNRPNSVT